MQESLNKSAFLIRIYGWMALGLAVTFGSAWFVAGFHPMIVYQPLALLLLTLAQVIVVISFSRRLMQASYGSVIAMFLAYSALNGVTMSAIFLFFNIGVIYLAFGAAAVAFLIMALFGTVTRRDLSGLRGILTGGLIALIVLTLAGLLFGLDRLQLLICAAGIVLFLGLTAYDTQKLLQLHTTFPASGARIAVYGALQLYLDFINLFQFILILTGGRRRH